MGEKPSPYNQLRQTVARAQEEKEEGGCFAEYIEKFNLWVALLIFTEIKKLLSYFHNWLKDYQRIKQMALW